MDIKDSAEELARKLAAGEITAEEYKSRIDDLLTELRQEAVEPADDSASQSNVSDERIKAAARKARSIS